MLHLGDDDTALTAPSLLFLTADATAPRTEQLKELLHKLRTCSQTVLQLEPTEKASLLPIYLESLALASPSVACLR